MRLVLLTPAALALAAMLVGGWARANGRHRVALAGVAVVSVAIVVAVATGRDPDVSDGQFARGLALALLSLGLFPLGIYYGLGAALGPRQGVLGLVYVALVVPLYYYAFVALIFVADLVYCAPDAYECPL